MRAAGYPDEWTEAIVAYLAMVLDRLADQTTTLCLPDPSPTQSGVVHTFARFALPMTWDFIEGVPTSNSSGSFERAIDWVVKVLEHLAQVTNAKSPEAIRGDATTQSIPHVDLIVTDPPYYDAIPYADISDFFYVWLRRVVGDRYSDEFREDLSPKSDEIVQQKKGGIQGARGKAKYEQGMADAFRNASNLLFNEGRMVVVFAHKEPDAWETLVSAMIQSGFTVTASWPIDTERQTRMQSINAASLASSIWLVCRKRSADAGVGRYRAVRQAMETRITERLRYFWDIGISGPDFVWAAVGPALESYSSYDEVRRLDGSLYTVGEFLREVHRLVADFALGQILKGHSTEGLDEWTRYYLMHRNNFGLEGAPAGECILFAQGYGLDLNDLRGQRGFLVKATGSDLRLAKWDERTARRPRSTASYRYATHDRHAATADALVGGRQAGSAQHLRRRKGPTRQRTLLVGRPGHPGDGRDQVARADVAGGGGGVGAGRSQGNRRRGHSGVLVGYREATKLNVDQ